MSCIVLEASRLTLQNVLTSLGVSTQLCTVVFPRGIDFSHILNSSPGKGEDAKFLGWEN